MKAGEKLKNEEYYFVYKIFPWSFNFFAEWGMSWMFIPFYNLLDFFQLNSVDNIKKERKIQHKKIPESFNEKYLFSLKKEERKKEWECF